MVSIRKYLEMHGRGPEDLESATVLTNLCSGILNHIGTYVLTGESSAEFRAALDQARAPLDAGSDTEVDSASAAKIGDAVRSLLAAHAARDREAGQRVAVETQHVVGVLNYALMVLSGGSQRSLSRLERVQESLQHTAQIRDVEGLRASLADAMKLIREEAAREKEHAANDLASVESEVVKVRERLAANPVRRLPGRAEAIQALSDICLGAGVPKDRQGLSLCLAAFSFANINAIAQRYGPDQMEELFLQVIRERVYPMAAVNSAWRWSPGCIISVFERKSNLLQLQSDLAELCRIPLVYRMMLGGRTAVLKVNVSHFAAVVSPETLQSLIEQVDRFGGVRG